MISASLPNAKTVMWYSGNWFLISGLVLCLCAAVRMWVPILSPAPGLAQNTPSVLCLQKTFCNVAFPSFSCIPCIKPLGCPTSPWAFSVSRGSVRQCWPLASWDLALFVLGGPRVCPLLTRHVTCQDRISGVSTWLRLLCIILCVAAFCLFFTQFYLNEGAFISLMKYSLLSCVLKILLPFPGCQMAGTSQKEY